MQEWLSIMAGCYAVSALILWGDLDVAERKWYRGKNGIKRLLLHSFILGTILALVGPHLPMW